MVPSRVNEAEFFLELLSDPDEAQFVHDVLTGEQPMVPGDETLRQIYQIAANKVVKAPASQRTGLLAIVGAVNSVSYSDKDYSQADILIP
ncbi:MAG TPA: hypothetical protein VFI84_03290 [Candidatus Saccharimonadales bacterium]|nr:hypothetical protein [Candidatus Saccharimonadales bacterium]